MLSPRNTAKTLAATLALTAMAGLPLAAQAHANTGASKMTLTAKRANTASTRSASETFRYSDTLRQDGRTIGTDTAICTHSDPIYFTCEMTIKLAGGSLKVSIPSSDDTDTIVADIYKATGRYSGKTGTLTITNTTRNTARYTINLH